MMTWQHWISFKNWVQRFTESNDEKLLINADGIKPVAGEINCGESGLSIRMFTPIAALSQQQIVINGTGSLLKRPMDFFDEIFPQAGY
jgi:3-phosphoshikimate 1-carboxyvinyltransferase